MMFKAFPTMYSAKIMALANFYQTRHDSLHDYYLKLKDLIDALDHYGTEIGTNIGLIKDAAECDGVEDTDLIQPEHPKYLEYTKAIAREQYLAVCFLQGADRTIGEQLHRRNLPCPSHCRSCI